MYQLRFLACALCSCVALHAQAMAVITLDVAAQAGVPDLVCRPKPTPTPAPPTPVANDDPLVQPDMEEVEAVRREVATNEPEARQTPARQQADFFRRAMDPTQGLRMALWGDSHMAAAFFSQELINLSGLRPEQIQSAVIPATMNRPGVRVPARKTCVSAGWSYDAAYRGKEAADALRASETAISESNKRLRELAGQLKQAQADLDDLHRQIRKQQALLSTRREELAEQLRKQYASGLSPWTALLSGDDPQALGRNLGYLDYVSRARAETVDALRQEIDQLAELESRADLRQRDIAGLVRETTDQKAQLDRQKKERATVLARIEGQLAAQRAEAARLERDEKRLGELVNDLATQIAAARKAAEAARQRLRPKPDAPKKHSAPSRRGVPPRRHG